MDKRNDWQRIGEFVARSRNNGKSVQAAETAAMKEFGVSEPTVKRAVKRFGIERLAQRLLGRLSTRTANQNEALKRRRLEEAERQGLRTDHFPKTPTAPLDD